MFYGVGQYEDKNCELENKPFVTKGMLKSRDSDLKVEKKKNWKHVVRWCFSGFVFIFMVYIMKTDLDSNQEEPSYTYGERYLASIDPESDTQLFTRQDLTLFDNLSILFHGDSTLRMLWVNLKSLLACDQSEAPFFAKNGIEDEPKDVQNVFKHHRNLLLRLVWASHYPVTSLREIKESIQQEFSNSTQRIIIWNQGLHLLHLHPVRGFSNILFSKNYKKIMGMVMSSIPATTECVIFRTSNPIAIEKFDADYAVYSKLYAHHDKSTIRKCFRANKEKELCQDATLTNVGVRWVNRKMREFVTEYNEGQNGLGPRSPKLVLMDSYKLFVNKVNYTKPRDGRHYWKIKNLEVRLLKHVIENRCGIRG